MIRNFLRSRVSLFVCVFIILEIIFINNPINYLSSDKQTRNFTQNQKAQLISQDTTVLSKWNETFFKNSPVMSLGVTKSVGRISVYGVGPGPVSGSERIYIGYGYGAAGCELGILDPTNGDFHVVRPPTEPEGGLRSMEIGADNRIYFGTYSRAHIYRYDPVVDKLEDLGTPVPNNWGINGFAKDKDWNLYGGTIGGKSLAVEQGGYVIRINTNTSEITNLGRPDSDERIDYVVSLKYFEPNNSLYVSLGVEIVKIKRYDINSKTWFDINLPADLKNISGQIQLMKSKDGEIYFDYNNKYYTIEKDFVIQKNPSGGYSPLSYRYLKDGRFVESVNQENYAVLTNPINKTQTRVFWNYEGFEVEIFRLSKGPGNEIYISTGLPANLYRYDFSSKILTLLGTVDTNVVGEFYHLLPFNDKLYLIGYDHCLIYEYDPSLSFNTMTNPKKLANVMSESRPIASLITSNNEIAIGTIPAYGTYGGALIFYDLKRKSEPGYKPEIFKNIVSGHSVYSLVEMPGRFFVGGSSREGGTGTTQYGEGDAGIFVFDRNRNQRVGEIVRIQGMYRIDGLVRLDDDKVFGLALEKESGQQTPFIFSISTNKIIKTGDAFKAYTVYNAFGLAQDGRIYGLVTDKIITIDPYTLKITPVSIKEGVREGFAIYEGVIYFARDARLYSKQLLESEKFISPPSTPPPTTPTPASCLPAGQTGSPTLNSCAVGTFSDVTDTSNQSIWMCLGLNGGPNTTCSLPKDPNLSPTPTPLRATDGLCGTTLNSCTQGILRNTEDSTTQYLWMCLGSNNGFDASCSQNRYIPPVTTNPPTNPVTQTQTPRVNQSTTRPNTPTIYKTGTTPNKDTYTINIPTSTIDITLPKPPSWLDLIKALLNKIITNIIRGIKRTGEVVGDIMVKVKG